MTEEGNSQIIETPFSPEERAIITPAEQEIIDIRQEQGSEASLEIMAEYFGLFKKRGLLIDPTTTYYNPEYLWTPDLISGIDELVQHPPGERGEIKIVYVLVFNSVGEVLLVRRPSWGGDRWFPLQNEFHPDLSENPTFENFNEGLVEIFASYFDLDIRDFDVYMFNRFFTRNYGCRIINPQKEDFYPLWEQGEYVIRLLKGQESRFKCGKGIKDLCWVDPGIITSPWIDDYYDGLKIDEDAAVALYSSWRYPCQRMLQKPIKVEF